MVTPDLSRRSHPARHAANRLRLTERGRRARIVDLATQAGDLALLMPSIPKALTRSSTERVEMPWM